MDNEGSKRYMHDKSKYTREIVFQTLTNTIRSGIVNPKDLPIEYIVRTGNSLFEGLLTNQLTRNKLTSIGIEIVRRSGGN